MEGIFFFLLICVVSFSASILTFFSGFGLGTLLLPVFSLFMPIELAVLATAIVHILNNALKFILIRNFIDKAVLISFEGTLVDSKRWHPENKSKIIKMEVYLVLMYYILH